MRKIIKVPAQMIAALQSDPTALALYVRILRADQQQQGFNESIPQICAIMGIGDKTARRCLNTLVEAGAVSKKTVPGRETQYAPIYEQNTGEE